MESIDILDKKKIEVPFEEIIAKITQASNFILSEVDSGLILEVNRTKGLKDLHDRVIVVTAKLFDAYLISKDRIIKSVYPKTIW